MASWTQNPGRFWRLLGSIMLAAVVGGLYLQVAGHGFLNWDDQLYVYSNRWVVEGLTPQTIRWAFENLDAVNYHPLTWLSHLLDVSLFREQAGLQKLQNPLWHAAAAILAFFAFSRWLGRPWMAFFIALVWALHPVNVENVAWLSQRKSVINAFFCFATILAYARYCEKSTLGRYLGVILLFWTSLLAKSASVTLPFVLLLFDILWHRRACVPWLGAEPLGLRAWWQSGEAGRLVRILVEKLPLVFLSLLVSVLTYIAQRDGGAMPPESHLGFLSRLMNATRGYLAYLEMFLFPTELAGFYPQGTLTRQQFTLGVCLLSVLTLLALMLQRTRPLILIGWLWFVGSLIPMIGLVQVGAQAYADRYLYLAMPGLLLVVWELGRMLRDSGTARLSVLSALAAVWMFSLSLLCYAQVFYWRDSLAFFSRTLEITGRHRFSVINTASELIRTGDTRGARNLLSEGRRHSTAARVLTAISYSVDGESQKALELAKEAYADAPQDFDTGELLTLVSMKLRNNETDGVRPLLRQVLFKTHGYPHWNIRKANHRKWAEQMLADLSMTGGGSPTPVPISDNELLSATSLPQRSSDRN